MVPSMFVATQAISPACDAEAIVIIKRPPVTLTPVSSDVSLKLSNSHRNSAVGLASASHMNVTDEFSGTVALIGWCVMAGGSVTKKWNTAYNLLQQLNR